MINNNFLSSVFEKHQIDKVSLIEINEKYIRLGYFVAESTRPYIPKLVEQGVTAILFSHDVRAISAIAECKDLDIQIPKDLSLIGFDDLPMTAYTDPPLTTISQDRIALGKCGYYAMTSLMNHVPIGSILLRAPLIIRSSTGPAPKHPVKLSGIFDEISISDKLPTVTAVEATNK